MNSNTIVIESSDDEEPVLKKAKIEHIKPQGIQIGEIKSLVEKEIVVIEDEEESQEIAAKEEKTSNTNEAFEANKTKLSNNDLNIEVIKTESILIPESSNQKTVINETPITEDTKTEKSPKRIQLTPITAENIEVDENFTKKNEENLLEPSISALNTEIQENGVSSTSEEKSNELIEEFELFLNTCKNCKCKPKPKNLILKKLSKLEEKYNQANENYIKSNMFKKLLRDNISKINRKPSDTILFFSEVYEELNGQKKRTLELSEKNGLKLKKLQEALKKANKKINQLETAECNFDKESDSEYLMLDCYKKRATLIYKKICSITNDNPYASRQMHKNLDISCSKYSEINRAIGKLYSKTKQFPSFYDVDRCIRKCVKQNNLVITDSVLKSEINTIFQHVGELLKRRRKLETYETINDLVKPAEEIEDPELEKLMDERHIENEKRIDDILKKYVEYQEKGKNPTLSPDTDDSNQESEDSTDE